MKSIYFNEEKEVKIEEIKEAANGIKEGKLVLFPTETVYGIGANALDTNAVQKIFVAKGRASDNPLIVHISNINMLEQIVENIGEIEKRLINKFWPGPLTIIFNRKSENIIPNRVTAGLMRLIILRYKKILKLKKYFMTFLFFFINILVN